MKILSLGIVLLYGFIVTMPKNLHYITKVEKNGMEVSWKFNDDHVDFVVMAPTKGWIAIGLNKKDQLIHSNLIMGKIDKGQVIISDRYIVAFGEHRDVEHLGGKKHISKIGGEERLLCTYIKFSLPLKSEDSYHIDLAKGKQIGLTLAYSMEKDFAHHSVMRTSLEVEL